MTRDFRLKAHSIFWMVLAALALALAPVARAERPDAPPFALPGPYAVGVRDFVVDDDPARPLEATVWYPALAGGEPRVEYPIFGVGQALADAVPDTAGAPYPLIVFSHGFGGTRHQSTFFTEHLASHGFVVMAVDHPGTSLAAIGTGRQGGLGNLLDLGTVTDAIFTDFALRPLDVIRQLDAAARLTAPGGVLEGLIDVERAAVTGHSFGGYTAVAAGGARLDFGALRDWCNANLLGPDRPLLVCLFRTAEATVARVRGLGLESQALFPPTTDTRLKAVVALAPWNGPIFGETGLAALTVPTMVIVGSADRLTPAWRDADAIYEGIGSETRMLVTLEYAGHLVFVGPCPPEAGDDPAFARSCIDPVWDMQRAHDLVNHFATAFFLATLNADAGAAQALTRDAATFIGVTVRAERP
jgi:predicted dienelactone hydrolase